MTANPAHGYPPHIPDEDTTITRSPSPDQARALRLLEYGTRRRPRQIVDTGLGACGPRCRRTRTHGSAAGTRTRRNERRPGMSTETPTAQQYPPSNPEVGKVSLRIEAWPHDPGANGEEYVSGHMPAAEAAKWLRDIADRCERYWADPECPWAGDDGHAPATPLDEERERERHEAAKLASLRAAEATR